MKNVKSKLTKKEVIFCHEYIEKGNSAEAAKLAGYKKRPAQKGAAMLAKPAIGQKIKELYEEKRKNLFYKATSGYQRLAFGNISDAIKLLFAENISSHQLENMDLFNIAEIKKPKDGAMEIKFFDRLRALEKLEQLNLKQTDEKDSFFCTLEKSIKNLSSINNEAEK